jgi:hypothetical protein
MGTGVGEAMLIGAAVGATAGGAGAAIQGGDPLEGALVGGALGGVGGGLGAGFGAGAGAKAGAAANSTSLVPGAMAGAEGAALSATAPAAVPGSIGFGTTGATNTGIGSIYAGAGQGVNTATQLGSSIASGGAGIPAGLTGAPGSALPAGFGSAPVTAGPGNFTGFAPQLSNTALGITAGSSALAGAMGAERDQLGIPTQEEYDGPLNRLRYDPDEFTASTPTYAPGGVYRPTYGAEGGIMRAFQAGGPVDRMSQMNAAINPQGGLYPQGMIDQSRYAMPLQRPTSMEILDINSQKTFAAGGVARYAPGGMVDPSTGIAAAQQSRQPSTESSGIDTLMGNKKRMMTKEQMEAVKMQGMSKDELRDVYGEIAAKGLAKGGTADLGGYSDGGRMLKGPGDGMSDSIPGVIADKQPARLADGEFVVPADVVSHLGNGSTDAGAKQLYAMMNRVRKARTGSSKQGKQIKPAKYVAA